MRYEGSLEVLNNLFRKKQLLKAGDVSSYEIRPALLANTGVLRGAYGGGQGVALDAFGLNDVFDVAIGVSTGFPVLAYLLAHQIKRNVDIYWKEAASKDFVSFQRFLSRKGPIADIEYLCSVFRGQEERERLRDEVIKRSRTKLFAGVTCAETGREVLLDAKRVKPDLVAAIHATCAMPGLSPQPVTIDGRAFVDGATAMTFPVRKVIEQFAPTDLLVFANRSGLSTKLIIPDRLTSWPFLRKCSRPVRAAYSHRYVHALEELAYLRVQRSCRYLILWTDDKLGRFTRDSAVLAAASRRAQVHLESLLARAQEIIKIESQTLAAE